jgi:hypothetical protein
MYVQKVVPEFLLAGPRVVATTIDARLLDNEIVLATVLLCVDVVDGPEAVVSHDWPARCVAKIVVSVREDVGASNPVGDTAVDSLVVPPAVEQDVLVWDSN